MWDVSSRSGVATLRTAIHLLLTYLLTYLLIARTGLSTRPESKARAVAGWQNDGRVESSRVWTFVAGAELAVQSQQRRTAAHDTHSCSQHCLVLEQTSGSCAGA